MHLSFALCFFLVFLVLFVHRVPNMKRDLNNHILHLKSALHVLYFVRAVLVLLFPRVSSSEGPTGKKKKKGDPDNHMFRYMFHLEFVLHICGVALRCVI